MNNNQGNTCHGSTKEIFDEEKVEYKKALKEAGHRHHLKYKKTGEEKMKKKTYIFQPPIQSEC